MHLTFLCLLVGHRDIRCVVMISKLSQTDRWIAIQFSRTRMLFSSPVSSRVCVKNSAHPYGKEKSRKGKHNRSLPIRSPLLLTLRTTRWIYEPEFEMETNYFFVMKIVTNCFGIRRVKYTFDFSPPINVHSIIIRFATKFVIKNKTRNSLYSSSLNSSR